VSVVYTIEELCVNIFGNEFEKYRYTLKKGSDENEDQSCKFKRRNPVIK
jgi:rRNA maturation protein Nop10